MRQKSVTPSSPSERLVKTIRRASANNIRLRRKSVLSWTACATDTDKYSISCAVFGCARSKVETAEQV
jgi:hypothetical protein